ncbi:MAG: rhomboid family intramembrane serine protease [Planctomycetaceae bacterium]
MLPLQTTVVSRHPPVVTWVLIAFNALFFYFELQMSPESLERFTYLFGIVPARYTHPEWAARVGFPIDEYWPFLTSMFLHGGWAHIIGNMWTLWLFGQHVEDRMGPFRFLSFYLLCGISSGLVHTWINADSTVPAIGASGAIAGVMGAYLVMFPTSRVIVMIPIFIFPLLFEFLAVFYLGYWFFLQLISGMATRIAMPEAGGIAFWAHIGGFVTGLLIFGLFLRPGGERRAPYPDEGTYEHGWMAFR